MDKTSTRHLVFLLMLGRISCLSLTLTHIQYLNYQPKRVVEYYTRSLLYKNIRETLSTIANKLRLDADRLKERNKSHLYGLNGSSHLKSGTALNPGMVVYYDASLDEVLVGEKVLKRCHRAGPSYHGKVEAHDAEKGRFTGVHAIGI